MLGSFVLSVGLSLSAYRAKSVSSGQRISSAPTASAVPSEYQSEYQSSVDAARAALNLPFEREELKRKLLRVCAACNRGFGASALDRASCDALLGQLTCLNPCAEPTDGVSGCASGVEWVGRGFENRDYENGASARLELSPCGFCCCYLPTFPLPDTHDVTGSPPSAGFTVGAQGPLDGVWRLIYTNATDVLSLDVNPIAGIGPISQEITLPDRVVNVIVSATWLLAPAPLALP